MKRTRSISSPRAQATAVSATSTSSTKTMTSRASPSSDFELDHADLAWGGAASCGAGISCGAFAGTRMLVEQLRHRTVFPRHDWGTASTLRHIKFGHMIRTLVAVMEPSRAFAHCNIGRNSGLLHRDRRIAKGY